MSTVIFKCKDAGKGSHKNDTNVINWPLVGYGLFKQTLQKDVPDKMKLQSGSQAMQHSKRRYALWETYDLKQNAMAFPVTRTHASPPPPNTVLVLPCD